MKCTLVQFIITGGSLEDSKNALNLAESRGNALENKVFCSNSVIIDVFNIKVDVLSAFLKMSSFALLAAIPLAVVILSRMVNPSTYQD